MAGGVRQENDLLVSRLHWLIEEQQVRPKDILVPAASRQRAMQLVELVDSAKISGVGGTHLPFDEKDKPLGRADRLTV